MDGPPMAIATPPVYQDHFERFACQAVMASIQPDPKGGVRIGVLGCTLRVATPEAADALLARAIALVDSGETSCARALRYANEMMPDGGTVQ